MKHYYSRSSEPCVSAAGIIDTDPAIATVKVSRKLVPELASARPGPGAAVQLLEVRGEDAPNVLTNDPGFFSHKTGDAAVLELKLSTEFRNNIKLNSPSIDIFTDKCRNFMWRDRLSPNIVFREFQ